MKRSTRGKFIPNWEGEPKKRFNLSLTETAWNILDELAIYILQSVRDEAGQIVDFQFVDLNSKGEELISLPREGVINQRLCELLPVNRSNGFFEKYKQVVETGVALEEEFPISASGVIASWLHHQVVPLGDGIAIISRERIPAVALTAYAREEDRAKVLLAGFQQHLPKPVSPDELAAVVASLTGRTGSGKG